MLAITTLAALLVAACGVAAYDFSNAYFNHELNAILEDLDIAQRRTVREVVDTEAAHCEEVRKNNHLECCGPQNNTVKINPGKGMDLVFECAKEHAKNTSHLNHTNPFSCEAIIRERERIICLSECVAKKVKLLDDDGHLNVPLVKENVKKNVKEEWKQEITNKALDDCAAYIEKVQAKLAKHAKHAKHAKQKHYLCNAAPLFLTQCIWSTVQLRCPKEHQVNNQVCNHLRDEITHRAEQQQKRHKKH